MSNVESIVIDWASSLPGAEDWPIFGDMPEYAPIAFVLVDRTGGPREAMVLDRAEILFEIYHKESRLNASNKANELADAVPILAESYDDITRSAVNSVVNLPDTIAGYHRYQVYCDVYYRR